MMGVNKINYPKIILVEVPQNLYSHIVENLAYKKIKFQIFETFEEALTTLELESNVVITLSHRFLNFLEHYKNVNSIALNYYLLIYQYFDDLDKLIVNYPKLTFDYVNALVSSEIINYKVDKLIELITKTSMIVNDSLFKKYEDENAYNNVDTLIQNLEFNLLKKEISEEKLERELALKKIYESELSKLNNLLQEQITRVNDLNKELKSFTYSVTHDIKAPLRGIIGYSQELIKRHSNELNDRAKYCIKQIDSAAKNLESLIQDLLLYTKLEIDIPVPVEVNLTNILNQIINSRLNEIYIHKTKINFEIEHNIFFCWERGLTQVLSNLIDNAIKYSSKSENPEITISSKINNDKILISVKDNGIGFDMKYHDKIFELFHRIADQSIYEGTGAGLAICKRIINKIHGSIWAVSEISKGSTFFIELPLLKFEL